MANGLAEYQKPFLNRKFMAAAIASPACAAMQRYPCVQEGQQHCSTVIIINNLDFAIFCYSVERQENLDVKFELK